MSDFQSVSTINSMQVPLKAANQSYQPFETPIDNYDTKASEGGVEDQ
jgi:hypothetical protein